MNTIDILLFIGYLVLIALAEIYLDMKVAKVIDEDGTRTKSESALLHGNQIPWRIVSIFLAASVFHSIGLKLLSLVAVGGIIYWILFDSLVNLVWLKKSVFYVGGTSKIDRLFKGKKWGQFVVKGVLLVIFIFIYEIIKL